MSTKRPNLIDAVVLVAATAIGFAPGRALTPSQLSGAESIHDVVANYTVSIALIWTLAILALNLTRYRTTPRDLAARPGFTASIAVVVERTSAAIYWAVVGSIGPLHDFGSDSGSSWRQG
jgi:hypothetical protein